MNVYLRIHIYVYMTDVMTGERDTDDVVAADEKGAQVITFYPSTWLEVNQNFTFLSAYSLVCLSKAA
jgi:hypothetical protein